MDVIEYLEKDHEKVLNLLKQLQKSSPRAINKRHSGFSILKQELYLHEQVEQQVLYSALKKKDKALILEAFQEHHLVNMIIEDIESIAFNHENWLPKIIVMNECLEHHIKEERGKIFPLTKKLFDKPSRIELADEMKSIKKRLKIKLNDQ